jgi:hypothetical protein
VVPVCFDSSKYLQSSATFEPGLEAQGKFRFYAISNDEKNVDKVIKCFHSEFDHSDNAVLVIQINQNKDGTSKIDEKIYEVKKSLGLNKEPTLYKKDIVVEKPVRADSTSMHQFGDCYVSVSSRRTINSEDIDAMGFGNTPIVSDQSDAAEYVDKQYCVKSLFKINTNQSAWRDVNNGKDYQIDTCEKEIKSMMRRLYEEWCQNPMRYKASKRQEGITRINTFSIDSVGKTMKELLNA